jgi:hypothetical protein
LVGDHRKKVDDDIGGLACQPAQAAMELSVG